jgi:hypothetical protein
VSKIPSLNRGEAEFFRRMDEIATGVVASLDEFADDVAGDVSPEVEQWLRCAAAMVQELTTYVLALAAASTEHERTNLMRALDAVPRPYNWGQRTICSNPYAKPEAERNQRLSQTLVFETRLRAHAFPGGSCFQKPVPKPRRKAIGAWNARSWPSVPVIGRLSVRF